MEDYLLKPITKNALIERLTEIRSRYEHEKTQKEYYEEVPQRNAGDMMKNSSRDFFEALVSGSMDMMEIYRRSEKLGLDIVAEAYNCSDLYDELRGRFFRTERRLFRVGGRIAKTAGGIFLRKYFGNAVPLQYFFLWCPDKRTERDYRRKYQKLCERDPEDP